MIEVNINDELVEAVTLNDTGFALTRIKARTRIIDAVQAVAFRHLELAKSQAESRGYTAGRRENTYDAARALAEARRAGYADGRREALHEAATMLKRHGHRAAVTRVNDLATAARPQETPQSPADEPGTPTQNTPQEAPESPSEPRTPTGTAPNPAAGPSVARTGPPEPSAAAWSRADLQRLQARRG